ncbi:MAG: hypothetical protein HYR84_15475 [Planctomycetes bacterium]|nr:hypothetical protein [Planctomycetota bacterium]
MTNSTSTPGTNVGRARQTPGQLWQVPLFLAGLLAFIGVAASAPWRLSPQEREFVKLVTALRVGLEQDEAPDVLAAYADSARLWVDRFPSRSAEAHFLIGSAYYRQALRKPPSYAKTLWPIAVSHLEKGLRNIGDADQAALQYRLGYCLHQQNAEDARALELMTLGAEKGAEHPLQAYRLLVQANLKRKPADIHAALSANRRVLDLTPERDVEAAARARLQQGELLIAKGARSEAAKELERIGPKAPRAVRVSARLLQAKCWEAEGQWAQAIPIWKELLADAASVEGKRPRILYALGLCYQKSEPANAAEAIRVWSEALRLGGVEGQAAGLRLGQLRFALGTEIGQALADWQAALEPVHEPKDYRNPHVDIEQVRGWLKQALEHSQKNQDPQKTEAVAQLFRRIAPAGVAEVLVAEAAQAVADQLADQRKLRADSVKDGEVEAQYRRAAEAFERAAQARPEAERADALWRSAHCYRLAMERGHALRVLNLSVRIENAKEDWLAEAWQTLGDLYRADGKNDFARDAYHKCLQYPDTVFAYRARYYLAVEEAEKKNYAQAYEILKQNRASASLDIDRVWHEKTLFRMAGLLMEMNQYPEAHVNLKACLELFPENPNNLLVREQLGQCYRHMAEAERVKEKQIEAQITTDMPTDRRIALEESVRHQRKTRIETLQKAVTTYQELADELAVIAGKRELTKTDQTLLRRAWLGIGECHLDNEEYGDALTIFTKLQGKYRGTLEGFYACPFICFVVDKMQAQQLPKQRIDEVRELAQESVRLLIADLKSLPADHEVFSMHRVPPKTEWLRWADDTLRKLQAPPRIDSGLPAFR